MDTNNYSVDSLDVVKKISIFLSHYFTRNRKETCFDLSGPNLPLKLYPTRYQKTLIDYQQDVSKPVKHYFSSFDLRKRLTTFKQETKNKEREQMILHKIEEYIICINKDNINSITVNESRRPPWDSTWWKSNTKSFTNIEFLKTYGSRRENFTFSRQPKDKTNMKTTSLKIRRNYGSNAILKTCPHPYASRGEAERIINHAARLLLVTENYNNTLYDHTAPGMKIVKKLKPKKKNASQLSTRIKDSTCDKPMIRKELSSDSVSTNGNKTNPFKIKKDRNVDISTPETPPVLLTSTSKPGLINNTKENSKKRNDILMADNRNVKEKENNKFCMGKKSVSVEETSAKKTDKKETTATTLDAIPSPFKKSVLKPTSSTDTDNTDQIEVSEDIREIPTSKKSAQFAKVRDDWSMESSSIGLKASYEVNDTVWLEDDELVPTKPYPKNNNCPEESISMKIKQIFEVKVLTGDRIGASTNATIWLHIKGDKDSMKHSIELKKSSTHRRPFTRASTDVFTIKSKTYLGSLQSIQIGHDSDQPGSDWYLDSVSIRDCRNQLSYFFPCSKWLSVRSEDKQTRVNILSQQCMHEAKPSDAANKYVDVGTQCSNINDNNSDSKGSMFHQRIESKQIKKTESLSDLVVEFSELSCSEISDNSLMSVRRNDQQVGTDVLGFCDPLSSDVNNEAVISVKENVSNFPIDFNFNDERDSNTANSLNENAEDSYSPNPISFCDEDTS